MRNENLLSFLLIKRRILKLLAIKYAYSLIVLCGISFMACSDDDPVKKNPYLQTSTRAMLKEVVEVILTLLSTLVTEQSRKGKQLRLSLMLIHKVVTTRC